VVSDAKGVYSAHTHPNGFAADSLGVDNNETMIKKLMQNLQSQRQQQSLQQLRSLRPAEISLTPPPAATRKVDISNSRTRSYSLSNVSAARDQQDHPQHQQHANHMQIQQHYGYMRSNIGGVIYGLHKDSADSAASSACGAGAGAAAVGMSIASSAPAAGSQLSAHHHTGHGGRRRTTSSNSNG